LCAMQVQIGHDGDRQTVEGTTNYTNLTNTQSGVTVFVEFVRFVGLHEFRRVLLI